MSQWLVEAWYASSGWLLLLRPLELLYRIVIRLRRFAYHHALLRQYRAPVPVIVVGNITVGGSGKTPVVIALVEMLAQKGIQAGVVSRGYGATHSSFPVLLNESSTVAQCGEEAVMIYRRTHCPVAVAPDRAAAVRALLAATPVDLIVCDDGLQHYALERDMEIVMYDGHSAFGNGFCLPAGPLREPLARLADVDFVLGRGVEDAETGIEYVVDALVQVADLEKQQEKQQEATPATIGHSIYAVAGIGRPAYFFTQLETLGFTLERRVFPDHHDYRASDFARLQDMPIIMTEKDALKCQQFALGDAWYLRISAELPAAVIAAAAALARPAQHPHK